MFEESMADRDNSKVELRGMVARQTVDVLDAVSTARSMSRLELAEEVLAIWAREQVHVAMLIQRVTRGNGSVPDAARNDGPQQMEPSRTPSPVVAQWSPNGKE